MMRRQKPSVTAAALLAAALGLLASDAVTAAEDDDPAFSEWGIRRPIAPRNNSCVARSGGGCSECIRDPDCAWCLDPDWTSPDGRRRPRCDLRMWYAEGPSQTGCALVEDPENEVTIVSNDSLTSTDDAASSSSNFVQISPQRVRLRLRVGQEARVSFRVVAAEQYPVDIYYLMDLSNSMSDDRENVVKLGGELASAIRNITGDFRIGFGSFVDKEVAPFISLVAEKNCQKDRCPQPYSFQHQMMLGPNATLFQQRVQEADISGNIDNPEGGFDGLVQVMVCGDRIGWRREARRVVIFTTDQSFHTALDGKLGGIVRPNDGRCHLDDTGYYAKSKLQDYPSIGQVNYLARKHNVHVIWAVTEDKFRLYSELAKLVEGSGAGVISSDSSNVVELVRKQYEVITTTIRVTANSSANCPTQIKSKCKGRGAECLNVKLGTSVKFTLHAKLKSCRPETFVVTPVGIKDQMVVEVEPLCECPCAQEGDGADLEERCVSEQCNGHGHLVCGECSCCGDVFFGPTCNCTLNNAAGGEGTKVNPEDLEATCRPPGAKTSVPVCSGSRNGDCVCGRCVCKTPWTGVQINGEFCQNVCDNTACGGRGPGGALCSGHGECACGRCRCRPPYTGDDCECRVKPDECRAPETPNKVCSGHGVCDCDSCKCEGGYYGPYCADCATCQEDCDRLRPCAECYFFRTGDLVDGNGVLSEAEVEAAVANCTARESGICPYEFLRLNETKRVEEDITDWPNCTFKIGQCNYTFSYNPPTDSFPTNTIVLHLTPDNEDRLCPPPPDFAGIILGLIGAIVCVGLVTLFLWKAFTTIHDRREFAKFEAERDMMKWNTHHNPIFRQATTTVQNPTFNSARF